jgi:hypothetical protein
MKILHIIIILITVSVIAMTSLGIFVGKIMDAQNLPYTSMMINGMKENYMVREPIAFSVTLEGYGVGCGDSSATITRDNDTSYKTLSWHSLMDCTTNGQPLYFKFTSLSGNTAINQTGNYTMTVSFDDLVKHKKTNVQKFHVQLPIVTATRTGLSFPCENKFQLKKSQNIVLANGTSVYIQYTPVFLMKPNSVGKICTVAWSYDKSHTFTVTNSAGVAKNDTLTFDIAVVPYPKSMIIDYVNKTVVYTITTSHSANGFYRIGTNFDFCGGGFPLAVGYDTSHAFDNDFPWLWDTYPCPFNMMQQANTEVIGLSGIDVAYISKVY